METMALRGRKAVVTGGGRGIGAAVACALAEAGVDVLIGARSASEIDAVARESAGLAGRVTAHPVDVTDPASVVAFAAEARTALGPVDIVVNNAGIAGSAPLSRITLEDWNRMFAVNATGTFLCTREFVPAMRERGWGRVVNIASIAALEGSRYVAAYAASKHAVLGFTRSVAAELAGSGVTINAICPGYVDTPMTESTIANIAQRANVDRDAARKLMLESAAQSRLLAPVEIAHAVLYLCGEGTGAINGRAITFDAEGGLRGID